ncbi:prepilin-type N-terminal cleavage/methylation domain-containing protein [Candidatus Gracilibacteria bacterium]|nr:prepilin-type N-terminal cleavage/methylation domain-containing protein [Candidatus Gracilibacteria bacterium]
MMQKKGFTLVELIVVITILSILSTLGFVMYTDYLIGVRDSSRIQQMTEIHKSITLYGTRSRLPLPEESVSIVSGASEIGTQGYANQTVLDTIRYSDGGKDPKSKKYYTYFLSSDRRYAQILGFFEEKTVGKLLTLLPYSYAEDTTDYSTLYPQVYGVELGILLEDETQVPVQELNGETLDILTTTGSLISYLSNDNIISGSGEALLGMVPNTDCKKLLNLIPGLQSGIYKVNPSGIKSVNVYCEMDDSNKGYGEGWTLVARTHTTGGLGFSWLLSSGNVYDDSAIYSMGIDVKDIRFSEIMFAVYDTGKNITTAVKYDLNNQLFFSSEIDSPNTDLSLQYSETSNCEILYDTQNLDQSCYRNLDRPDRPSLRYWGAFGNTNSFVFNRQNSDSSGFMYSDGFKSGNNSMYANDSLLGKQGMLFIR